MRSRLAKNALILLSCGQLPVFSTTVLPVANFTRIMIPGSSWPHPPPTTNTRMASSATPLHESTTKKPFLHTHTRTLKTNQGTTLKVQILLAATTATLHSLIAESYLPKSLHNCFLRPNGNPQTTLSRITKSKSRRSPLNHSCTSCRSRSSTGWGWGCPAYLSGRACPLTPEETLSENWWCPILCYST